MLCSCFYMVGYCQFRIRLWTPLIIDDIAPRGTSSAGTETIPSRKELSLLPANRHIQMHDRLERLPGTVEFNLDEESCLLTSLLRRRQNPGPQSKCSFNNIAGQRSTR